MKGKGGRHTWDRTVGRGKGEEKAYMGQNGEGVRGRHKAYMGQNGEEGEDIHGTEQ